MDLDVARLHGHLIGGVDAETVGQAGFVAQRTQPLLHIGGVPDFDELREGRVGEDVDEAVLAHDGVL